MVEYKNRGWNFPIDVDYQTGNIKMTDLKDDIRQSIFILLSTLPGERLVHKDYGCNLSQFMFEPITYELIRKIHKEVLTAIMKWEKRIQNIEIDILNDVNVETAIVISIKYIIPKIGDVDHIYYTYNLN